MTTEFFTDAKLRELIDKQLRETRPEKDAYWRAARVEEFIGWATERAREIEDVVEGLHDAH